jgi:hypothetical protein
MGRKPIGETAMSSAERQRRYRQARSKADRSVAALEQRIKAVEARNAELTKTLNSIRSRPLAKLPQGIKQRLAKVCGMLGSAHAGERAAAAKMATDILRKAGMRWEDIVL